MPKDNRRSAIVREAGFMDKNPLRAGMVFALTAVEGMNSI
jgi:hypothetical protein